jgi:hypothetical protein
MGRMGEEGGISGMSIWETVLAQAVGSAIETGLIVIIIGFTIKWLVTSLVDFFAQEVEVSKKDKKDE